jgi:hypothetical protein
MSKRLALAGGFETHPRDPEATHMLMIEFQQNETHAQHTSFVFLLQIRASNYILRGYCQNTTVAKYIYNVCTNHCLGENLQNFKTTLHGMTAYLCNLIDLCLALLPECFDRPLHRKTINLLFISHLFLLFSCSIAGVFWLLRRMACA